MVIKKSFDDYLGLNYKNVYFFLSTRNNKLFTWILAKIVKSFYDYLALN